MLLGTYISRQYRTCSSSYLVRCDSFSHHQLFIYSIIVLYVGFQTWFVVDICNYIIILIISGSSSSSSSSIFSPRKGWRDCTYSVLLLTK
jgi:hypothetical protein